MSNFEGTIAKPNKISGGAPVFSLQEIGPESDILKENYLKKELHSPQVTFKDLINSS